MSRSAPGVRAVGCGRRGFSRRKAHRQPGLSNSLKRAVVVGLHGEFGEEPQGQAVKLWELLKYNLGSLRARPLRE